MKLSGSGPQNQVAERVDRKAALYFISVLELMLPCV